MEDHSLQKTKGSYRNTTAAKDGYSEGDAHRAAKKRPDPVEEGQKRKGYRKYHPIVLAREFLEAFYTEISQNAENVRKYHKLEYAQGLYTFSDSTESLCDNLGAIPKAIRAMGFEKATITVNTIDALSWDYYDLMILAHGTYTNESLGIKERKFNQTFFLYQVGPNEFTLANDMCRVEKNISEPRKQIEPLHKIVPKEPSKVSKPRSATEIEEQAVRKTSQETSQEKKKEETTVKREESVEQKSPAPHRTWASVAAEGLLTKKKQPQSQRYMKQEIHSAPAKSAPQPKEVPRIPLGIYMRLKGVDCNDVRRKLDSFGKLEFFDGSTEYITANFVDPVVTQKVLQMKTMKIQEQVLHIDEKLSMRKYAPKSEYSQKEDKYPSQSNSPPKRSENSHRPKKPTPRNFTTKAAAERESSMAMPK